MVNTHIALPHRKPSQRQTKSPPTSGRLSIREEHRRLTRERLLDAAYDVFGRVGHQDATIDDITACAGVNRATFYLHFKERVDLAAGLARRRIDSVAALFRKIDSVERPTRKDVRRWVESYLGSSEKDKILTRMLSEAMASEGDFGAEYCSALVRIADQLLPRVLARFGKPEQNKARSRIILLMMMSDRYVHHTVVQRVAFAGLDPVEALVDIWWNEVFSEDAIGRGKGGATNAVR